MLEIARILALPPGMHFTTETEQLDVFYGYSDSDKGPMGRVANTGTANVYGLASHLIYVVRQIIRGQVRISDCNLSRAMVAVASATGMRHMGCSSHQLQMSIKVFISSEDAHDLQLHWHERIGVIKQHIGLCAADPHAFQILTQEGIALDDDKAWQSTWAAHSTAAVVVVPRRIPLVVWVRDHCTSLTGTGLKRCIPSSIGAPLLSIATSLLNVFVGDPGLCSMSRLALRV